MTTCIALLRGINVGGRNKVAMADLRAVCEALGHDDVRTYVQSGNVVFATDNDDLTAVGTQLRARLGSELDVTPTVMVRTADELAAVVADNPFAEHAEDDPTKVHAAFLSEEPADPELLEFDPDSYVPEAIAVGDRVRYLHLPGGIGRSKLADDLARRRTGVEVTVRNWRTVTRLLEMARG